MGRLAPWWPAWLSLLVVLVPTVCVLWFMTEAVENRRQVVRRMLTEADFAIAQQRLDNRWQQQALALQENWGEGRSAAQAFREQVLNKLADSVVCFDAEGRLVYPAAARAPQPSEAEQGVDWLGLERLEYEDGDLERAAAGFETLVVTHADPAQGSFDANLAARALVAQARCLAKAGATEAAIGLLIDRLGQAEFSQAVDAGGRWIVAAADLRALELISDTADARFRQVVERLSRRLGDYDSPPLAAPQRRFLMRRVRELVAERLGGDPSSATPANGRQGVAEPLRAALLQAVEFPTLAAEELAAEFCEANPLPSKDAAIRLTQSPGVWQLAAPNKRVYGLYRTASVLARSQQAISTGALKPGAEVKVVPPGELPASDAGGLAADAGIFLPGWRLANAATDRDAEPVSDAQIAAYFWTATLVIAAMSIFAAMIAGAFRRQLRLARLKNDLVATVSHELKTPLSSIRLLVDTLLTDQVLEPVKAREYLELIAKENMRLSRLIDNFLAFSRMERKKYAFQFAETTLAAVIDGAVEAMRERLERPSCGFETELEAGLPAITADPDALITVMLNLLDHQAVQHSRISGPGSRLSPPPRGPAGRGPPVWQIRAGPHVPQAPPCRGGSAADQQRVPAAGVLRAAPRPGINTSRYPERRLGSQRHRDHAERGPLRHDVAGEDRTGPAPAGIHPHAPRYRLPVRGARVRRFFRQRGLTTEERLY